MKSLQVRVWTIRVNTVGSTGKKAKKSYTVRWTIASKEKARNFVSRALADNFRSELMQAVNRGEAFDTELGLPDSMLPKQEEVTWLTFVQRYVTMKWPGAAAKSCDSMTDALATVTPVLVTDVRGRPPMDQLRRALREYALPPAARDQKPPEELAAALRWLQKASLPLSKLTEATVVRDALDALALTIDGRAAAATTTRRKRSVFYNVLQYAVELELLEFNPVDKLRVRSSRKKVVEIVDRRVVVNPRQARELLTAVTYVGRHGKTTRGARLYAFFACMYFAALRPGEALGLRLQDCHLPKSGWGSLTLEKSRPTAGKRWTDSGEVHDDRGLKHRGEDEPRIVPIPPELIAILREHIDTIGANSDGRLFCSERGNPVSASTYSRVWQEARALALTPDQVGSPLAGRPYDLRHAGVSLWLNAGVHAPAVAERAGHSVDVLLKVYAKCIDGETKVMNRRIEHALRVW
jgi:integrase